MTRKLICFDLDGTLLNSRKEVPPENLAALEKLVELGHIVSIATGRHYKSAYKVSLNLPHGVEIIASNGAVVSKGGVIIRREMIPAAELVDIYHLTEDYGLNLTFDSLYAAYHTRLGHALKYSYFMNVLNKGPIYIRNVHIKSLEDYERYMPFFINAIVISKKHPDRVARLRLDLEKADRFNIESSGADNLEIIPRSSDKGTGALVLAEHYGIANTDIIAFGDQENDLKLLRVAGVGVAMGNASAYLKAHADLVSDTNDQGGIPKALREIFGDEFK